MRILVEKTEYGIHLHGINQFYVVEDVLQESTIDVDIEENSYVANLCICDQNFGNWNGPEMDFFDILKINLSSEKPKLLQAVQLIEKMLDDKIELVFFFWKNPSEFDEELTSQFEEWGFPVDKPNPLLPF